jgi:hypothetical protein
VRVYFARGNYAFSDGGEMTTDERGRFAFDQLPPDCPFTFIKEGYSEIEGRRLPLDTDAEVAVVMAPAGVILGQARDARTGRAVRAFTVRITFSPRRQPGDPSAGLASSLSDPGQDYQSDEGRFRLGDLVVGMPLQVTVAAEGYERRVAERVVAARPDAAQAEDFRLDPLDPAALRDYRGRLLAAEGEPVAGAQLRLIAARGRDPEARGAFPLNWPMIRTGQIALRPNVVRFLQAVTDAEGRFAFAGIPRDAEVELAWWGPGIAPGRADHLERLAEGKNEAIELSLPAPARIIGTVDRTRFADVGRVWVNRADGTMDNLDTDLKPGQTDFAIGDLAPGAYTVSLMGPYERLPGDSGGYTSRSLASVAVTVGPGETGRVSFPK